MPVTPFTERFNQVAKGMSEPDLMKVLDRGLTPVRALKTGDTQTLKLDAGLRLCRLRDASPWWLAGELEPPHDMDVELDGVRIAIYAPSVDGRTDEANSVRAFVADAIREALKKYKGTGSVAVHDPTRRAHGVAEGGSPDPDLVQVSRDLALLANTVKEQQAEMERLRQLVEPSGGRARRRAV